MATKLNKIKAANRRRKMRIRKRVHGTADRPRLVINRTLKHISASLVDDELGLTLTGIIDSKLPPVVVEEKADEAEGDEKKKKKKSKKKFSRKVELAFRVGQKLAEIAKERGIEKAVFDRNGLRYHGRVKALAEGARKGGLQF